MAASKSYAAAVKVSTASIAPQTDLTWPNAEDKFKKISDLKKAQKKATKAAQNRHRCLWIHEIHEMIYLESQASVNQRQEKTPKIRKRIV